MKVQKIHQSADAPQLDDWGIAGLPGTRNMKVSGKQITISGRQSVDTGIYEITPGTFRRAVEQAEVMHFLTGSGRFIPDGYPAIPICAGDTLFFEAMTEGVWEVDETLRKVYVIL